MKKILIADDQGLFLDMLCALLASTSGYEIVASAHDGKEAVALFKQHKPDVCLLDIQMPVMSGVEALKQIKTIDNEAKVIMLTSFGDDVNVIEVCSAYADGYILKDVKPETLLRAIDCVCAGLVCISPSVMELISRRVRCETPSNPADTQFSDKDMEIIRMVGSGHSNKQIAELLNYSEGTIRNRISAILAETALSDRTQLALFAIKNRLV